MTTYKLTGEGYVIKDGTTKVPTADVPGFDLHPETVAYREWLAVGGVPLPAAPAPVEVPNTCTPAQGLVALYAIKGITEADIANIINAIPDPVQRYTAQIGFTRATEWHRGSETMQGLALLLGLTEADLDALFVFAVGVRV